MFTLDSYLVEMLDNCRRILSFAAQMTQYIYARITSDDFPTCLQRPMQQDTTTR